MKIKGFDVRKWLSKEDPRATRKSLPEPIKVEQRLIHGELVEVKIYAPASSPNEVMEVDSSEGKTVRTIHQLFGNKLSEIWTGGKEFDIN